MIESLKKVFRENSNQPFYFAWPTIVFIFMQLVFVFAAIGIFLIYFVVAALLGVNTGIDQLPTQIAVALVAVLLIFFSTGLNASLARAYYNAVKKEKTSVVEFFKTALVKSPVAFTVQLIREFLYLLVVGPVVAVFYLYLKDIQYVDILFYVYVFFATFIVHMLFTPALISNGIYGTGLFSSLKNGFTLLRRRHIFFFGLYMVFAFVWLANIIPFFNIITLFFLYPLVYASMGVLMDSTIRGG